MFFSVFIFINSVSSVVSCVFVFVSVAVVAWLVGGFDFFFFSYFAVYHIPLTIIIVCTRCWGMYGKRKRKKLFPAKGNSFFFSLFPLETHKIHEEAKQNKNNTKEGKNYPMLYDATLCSSCWCCYHFYCLLLLITNDISLP